MAETKDCVVTVEYLGLVNNVLGQQREEYSIPEGATLRDLFLQILARHGEPFKVCALKPDGQLRPVTAVYVDNRHIQTLQGLDTQLTARPKVSVLVGVQPDPGG